MDTLPTPVFDVILDTGGGETTTHRVQVLNVDLVRYDRTAAKHGWPALGSAPSLWNTFVCWSAMRRTGVIGADMKYEAFEERALSVWPVSAGGRPIAELAEVSLNGGAPDDELVDAVGPTPPAREAG